MATKTTSLSYFYLSFYTLMLMIASETTSKASPVSPPPLPPLPPGYVGENSTEFIRARCGATLYPQLCYSSLASYSSAIQQSPVQLACAAANVTLSRLAALSASVAAYRRACPAAAVRAAAALRDCADAVGDAIDQVRRAAGELRGLDRAVGPEVAWRVSNAQTWMSAAMTNEDTCADGFHLVPVTGAGGAAKAYVCQGVGQVKQFTSNSLALVNALVAS